MPKLRYKIYLWLLYSTTKLWNRLVNFKEPFLALPEEIVVIQSRSSRSACPLKPLFNLLFIIFKCLWHDAIIFIEMIAEGICRYRDPIVWRAVTWWWSKHLFGIEAGKSIVNLEYFSVRTMRLHTLFRPKIGNRILDYVSDQVVVEDPRVCKRNFSAVVHNWRIHIEICDILLNSIDSLSFKNTEDVLYFDLIYFIHQAFYLAAACWIETLHREWSKSFGKDADCWIFVWQELCSFAAKIGRDCYESIGKHSENSKHQHSCKKIE